MGKGSETFVVRRRVEKYAKSKGVTMKKEQVWDLDTKVRALLDAEIAVLTAEKVKS